MEEGKVSEKRGDWMALFGHEGPKEEPQQAPVLSNSDHHQSQSTHRRVFVFSRRFTATGPFLGSLIMRGYLGLGMLTTLTAIRN
ncbi:hypothetical protein PM082_023127 [Marasmius tenuissimus]|nr:hypothetical protein PM082_023127 [Marasmius tenuissimus]